MKQVELNIKLIEETVRGNFIEITKLISDGADVNIGFEKRTTYKLPMFGKTPLIIIPLLQNNVDILEFFIKKGVNPLKEYEKGENVFDCVKDMINYENSLLCFDNQSAELFSKSRIQKILIENYPECYKELLRIGIITDEIKEKYSYIITAEDLNLL